MERQQDCEEDDDDDHRVLILYFLNQQQLLRLEDDRETDCVCCCCCCCCCDLRFLLISGQRMIFSLMEDEVSDLKNKLEVPNRKDLRLQLVRLVESVGPCSSFLLEMSSEKCMNPALVRFCLRTLA